MWEAWITPMMERERRMAKKPTKPVKPSRTQPKPLSGGSGQSQGPR